MARIWVHTANEGPRSLPIESRTIIGRGEHCDLVLDDDTVSWDHAELAQHGASYLLSDLGSRNGTVVNGRVIDKPARLHHGDVIQVGRYRLELDLPKVDRTTPRQSLSVELTDDERDVARALVAPYRREGVFAARPPAIREIAEQLHVSESSVKRRIEALAQKLELVSESPGDRPRLVADRVIALGLDQS